MATATLDDLISRTRDKANVLRSNFVTDTQIIVYLNEALREFRELVVTADDSYYQASLDFSIAADPLNIQALPAAFWKMRGLDAFALDPIKKVEVYAREFRERFAPGVGYYFGGDGNSIVVCGQNAEQANPFRLWYTPDPTPLAAPVAGVTRSIVHVGSDGTDINGQVSLINGQFSVADVGGTLVLSGTGDLFTDGTYTVMAIQSPSLLLVYPVPPPSNIFDNGTVATLTSPSNHTRTFAVAAPDQQISGTWNLQNGGFGPADAAAYLTIDVTNNTFDGLYTIIQFSNATQIRVAPQIAGGSGSLTGSASLTRQATGTRSALDVTEDRFAEYFSVRAAMTIARKKRQDTLVAQLAGERSAIEARIAELSRMRQSEPQQAPVLWGRRRRFNSDDLDV